MSELLIELSKLEIPLVAWGLLMLTLIKMIDMVIQYGIILFGKEKTHRRMIEALNLRSKNPVSLKRFW